MFSLALTISLLLVACYAAVRIAVDWWDDYRFWRGLRQEIKARENERKWP